MYVFVVRVDQLRSELVGPAFDQFVFFRFIQAFTRMTAFIGYRKKKNVWGQIQRQKIQLNQSSEQNVEKKIEGKK